MIRVLQIFSRMDRGGSETMIMNCYRNINREKIQFDFLVHTENKCAYDEEIISLGGRIYRAPFFKGYNLLNYIAFCYKFLKKHKEYAVIHNHYFTIAGLFMPIAKAMGIKKRILHSHTSVANQNISFLRRMRLLLLRRQAITKSTDLLACGCDAGKFLFHNRPFQVINNAIDAKKFQFIPELRIKKRKELQLENQFVIGHVGNFSEAKNHHFLIDVFSKIHQINSNARLLLIGSGSRKEEIYEKVIALKLGHAVQFLGSRSDVAELLMAMDIFLFPSLFEGLPVSVIEAQATGLPTIISDGVSDEAMITKQAYKIPLSLKSDEWAHQVSQIALSSKRSDAFEEICAAGYDVAQSIEQLERFYTDI